MDFPLADRMIAAYNQILDRKKVLPVKELINQAFS